MRAIFLNSWYAIAGKAFFDFIKSQSLKTDIFGLVEVDPGLFSKLELILPDFQGIYEGGVFDKTTNLYYGQAVFVKKNINLVGLGQIHAFRKVWDEISFASSYVLEVDGNPLYLLVVHGKARPGTKLDTPARIRQSKKIIESFKDKKGPKIIGGDFNLMPETRSIRLFEKAGYKNLIKDFDIHETRNRLSWEQFKGLEKQHFADYCFTSSEVKVKNFEVPNIEISDHLPLILDFEV